MMGAKSKIEWCDSSWNPVTGCTPVSAGCINCWAKRLAGRFPQIHGIKRFDPLYGNTNIIREEFNKINYHENRLDIPCHWRKPKRIFVCSMGDLFHADVSPGFVHEVFNVMLKSPQHTFLILTKRPENISSAYNFMEWEKNFNPVLPNLWLGVSVENQDNEWRIPILLQTPAAKRFVSVEPMLGPVDSWKIIANETHHADHPPDPLIADIDWVICGPETGPGARPMNLDWARSLRDQCVAAGVPFFYKRGELDGQLWHQFPKGRL